MQKDASCSGTRRLMDGVMMALPVVFLTIYIWTPGHIWVVNLSASVYYFGTISIDDDTLMKFGTLCIIIEMPRVCTMLTKPGKQGTGTSPCRQGLGT